MNSSADWSTLGPLDILYYGADQILRNAQSSLGASKVYDFLSTVRWNEPFIRALVLAQIVLFALTYVTRRRELVQFGILLLLTAVTLAAERLNEFGGRHWIQFATQNYFDGPGLFMMVFVSGPFVLLANYIVIGMGLRLVKLYGKRQRRQNQLSRSQQTENAATTSGEKKNR